MGDQREASWIGLNDPQKRQNFLPQCASFLIEQEKKNFFGLHKTDKNSDKNIPHWFKHQLTIESK